MKLLENTKKVFFFEEAVKTGGTGEIFGSMLEENGIDVYYRHIAVGNEFVKQASAERQIELYHLDSKSVVDEVLNG